MFISRNWKSLIIVVSISTLLALVASIFTFTIGPESGTALFWAITMATFVEFVLSFYVWKERRRISKLTMSVYLILFFIMWLLGGIYLFTNNFEKVNSGILTSGRVTSDVILSRHQINYQIWTVAKVLIYIGFFIVLSWPIFRFMLKDDGMTGNDTFLLRNTKRGVAIAARVALEMLAYAGN